MPPTKADHAYTILRARITSGRYGPGHRLVIDQLAREHQISSVPWREALRRLEAEGWVEIVPNVGALVSEFAPDELPRTMRLMARLEGLATALSAPRLSREDLVEARRIDQDAADALARFDTQRFGDLHRQFHAALCVRCDDERLLGMLDHEWTRLQLIGHPAFFYSPERALAAHAEHGALLNLIEGGASPELIEDEVRRHESLNLEAVTASAPGVSGDVQA